MIQMNPIVSVLMPIFNVGPYLREAIDSILEQSFKDFELIALDDCSQDESQSILETYTDPRIVRYRGEKNVGLANILNIGIMMARGKYIARMDSDDISLPQRLQIQVEYLDSHRGVDLISTGMQRFGTSNAIISHNTDFEDIKFNALFFSPVLHASSMWRKSKFVENNLFYRQEMVPSEDYDLWTRAIAHGVILSNIPDILYLYRTHQGQATSNIKRESKDSVISDYFIRTVFPGISDEQVQTLRNIWRKQSAESFKDVISTYEDANAKSGFFDQKALHKRLMRQYKAILFKEMEQAGIRIMELHELRIKQIVKVLWRRLLS